MGLTSSRLVSVLLLATLGMAYLVFPLLCRDAKYILGVVTNASVLSFISLGVWVTFAIGRINISQGAYALIGGYTAAILSTRYGVSFWVGLPLSGAIAAAVGGLLGWAILRLRGVYFAMITLSLTEAARLAFLNGGELTQGALGIVNIPRPQALSVAGVTLIPAFEGAAPLAFYYLSATLLGMGLLVVWRLSTSRLGGVFRALRQNEELAASLGIQIAKYRVIAYGVCCGMGGLGGAFFAAYHQNIYPGSYTVTDSVTFMLYCFVGGLDYVLNQTTEDWHTGCVTLSGAKGLVCRRDASPTAQHDSRPWSSQVYQCRVVRFRSNLGGFLAGDELRTAARYAAVPGHDLCAADDQLHAVAAQWAAQSEVTERERKQRTLAPSPYPSPWQGERGASTEPSPEEREINSTEPSGEGRESKKTLAPLGERDRVRGKREFAVYTMPMLDVRDLTKAFGGLTAVTAVSFAVEAGEILSIIGPNGAGKSTLFKLITAFLRPTQGHIRFLDEDISRLPPHAVAHRGIIRTFQETVIFREMTALQHVVLAHHLQCRASSWGLFLNTPRARADETTFRQSATAILEYLSLDQFAHEEARHLPHGHLRALGIAVALAAKPRLLLLDEPFTGLNPDETDAAVTMVQGLRDRGLTIMLVEHDMRAVMRISDRIIVLNFGTKIAEGTPVEIQRNDAVIDAYLGHEDREIGV